MKKTKKLIAVVLACIFALSCFGMSAYAAQTSEEAITADIKVTAPFEGGSPTSPKSTSNAILITDYCWAVKYSGESVYHVMSNSETFKSGNRYRIYIAYASPTSNLPSTNITINGNAPTSRSDSGDMTYGELYYDFGTLNGSGSGGGIGFFDIILSILGIPLYILMTPFLLIGLILGF